jgi:hypothetical protein
MLCAVLVYRRLQKLLQWVVKGSFLDLPLGHPHCTLEIVIKDITLGISWNILGWLFALSRKRCEEMYQHENVGTRSVPLPCVRAKRSSSQTLRTFPSHTRRVKRIRESNPAIQQRQDNAAAANEPQKSTVLQVSP